MRIGPKGCAATGCHRPKAVIQPALIGRKIRPERSARSQPCTLSRMIRMIEDFCKTGLGYLLLLRSAFSTPRRKTERMPAAARPLALGNHFHRCVGPSQCSPRQQDLPKYFFSELGMLR